MGLFNKKTKHLPVKIDLNFDANSLNETISRLSPKLFDSRQELGTKVFVNYAHKLLNLEILKIASVKGGTSEQYAYQQGRIDALKDLINRREKFLADEQHAETKDKAKATDHKSTRSYISRPSTAGLS